MLMYSLNMRKKCSLQRTYIHIHFGEIPDRKLETVPGQTLGGCASFDSVALLFLSSMTANQECSCLCTFSLQII